MWKCPVCGHTAIGKVGADQFYCWDCCIEFSNDGITTTIYNVELDGSLSLIDYSQSDAVNLEVQKG